MNPLIHITSFRFSLLLIIFLLPNFILAQAEADSISIKLSQTEEPFERILLLNKYAKAAINYNVSRSLELSQEAVALSQKLKNDTLLYASTLNRAIAFHFLSKFDKAFEDFIKNKELAIKLKDDYKVIESLNAIGNEYTSEGRSENAISTFKDALAYSAKHHNDAKVLVIESNLAGVYQFRKEYDSSNYLCYSILKRIKIKNNKDYNFLSDVYTNIISNYMGLKQDDSIKKYIDTTISLKLFTKDYFDYAGLLYNMGGYYYSNKKFNEAENYYRLSLKGLSGIGSNDLLLDLKIMLARTLYKKLVFEESARVFDECLQLKDSIYNSTTQSRLSEMEVKYETGKKEEELKRLAITSEMDALKLKHSKMWLLVSIAGALFCLLGAAVLFRQFKSKQSANKLLETQNHEILEQKKEITDSINYAKRIQTAILPPKRYVDSLLKNNFIFYAPKDIVSGDFYWVDSRDGKVLFAAVDCTGHGVPGALMSVVGYNLLSQSVKEKGLTSPAKILSYLDEGVHQTLRQSQNESGIKDGMDLAICCLHPDNTLEYAGVYNSVCLVRKNIADTFTTTSSRMAFYGKDLLEIKSDKIPIGNNENDVADEFTNHKLQLQSGDCVYLYSDGFADQFGGPKGKKFKYNQLKDELIAIHSLSPNEQRERLSSSFIKWKGSLEQVDDILVIGVKI